MVWPAEPQRLPKDAPNILIVLLDDVGFGISETLRRRGAHADARPAGRRGHQLQRVPHHLDLLADARLAADRPQPYARRLRHDRRARGGLRRLYRRHPEDRRDRRRGAEELRLPHRGLRQVAQHAGDRDDRDRAEGPLAERLRLRIFLRLPRRRDLAVGAAPDRELRRGRAAARRSEIPPDHRHGRQGAGMARRLPRLSIRTSRS